MLDPFTALNIAAAVVQFVDFGSKILSDSYAIYKSSSTSEHEDIKSITTDLATLTDRIRHGLEPVSGPDGPSKPHDQVSRFLPVPQSISPLLL
jgi:hypothetical protein